MEPARDIISINARKKTASSRLSLSKRAIEALPLPVSTGPKPVAKWYYDTTPRLCMAVWSNGTRVWYWMGKMKNGRKLQKKLAGFPEMSPERAREKAREFSNKVFDRVDPRIEDTEAREERTLQELFDEYMEGHSKKVKRSWREDEGLYCRYLKKWSTRRLSDVTTDRVNQLHAKIGTKHKTAANRMLSLLSTMFSYAQKMLKLKIENPCKDIVRYPETKREKFFKSVELPLFFEALSKESQDMQDYFLLALLTGQRRGNVQAAKWSDLNLDTGLWMIPLTKSGESLTVHLPVPAIELLRRRKESSKSEYVFPSRKGSKQPFITYQYRSWHKICKAAKLDGFRPHDLRHSLASFMAAGNVSLSIIGKALGHTQTSTTQRYSHLTMDPVRNAVNGAVDIIMAAKPKSAE